MKKFATILAGVPILILTLGTTPAQAAINIGAPIENSGSVVTIQVNPSYNQSSLSSYIVIYPTVAKTQTSDGSPGQTGSQVSVPVTGQTPTSLSTGSTQPDNTSQTSGTSVVSLGNYLNNDSSTQSSGTSSVPIVVPVSGQSSPSTSTAPGSSSTTTTTSPATPSSYPTIPPVTSLTADQQSLVDMVNQARANAGLAPLTVDFRLVSVAQAKAQDMKTNNYFGHISPTYGTPWAMMAAVGLNVQWAGENIAYNDSVAGAMAAWMQSPGHRANILDPRFTHIGIGIVYGSAYGNLYVQEFAQE